MLEASARSLSPSLSASLSPSPEPGRSLRLSPSPTAHKQSRLISWATRTRTRAATRLQVRHWREGAVESSRSKAHLLAAAHEVAADEGVGDAYRVVFNTGTGAGQTVFHIHAHVIGGRNLEWPPG